VQAPVDGGGVGEQVVVDLRAAGAAHDAQVRVLDGGQVGVGHGGGEAHGGFALEQQAQLERVVDELQVDVGDLQAALRHGAQQALGLQARDQLAHGPQRHAEQLHELALRHELTGPDVGLHDLLAKALVRLGAQGGGWRAHGAGHAEGGP
jgi:hypothetical protein